MRHFPFRLIFLCIVVCSLAFNMMFPVSIACAEPTSKTPPVTFLEETNTSSGQANMSDPMNVFAILLKVILYLIIIIGIFFIVIKALGQKKRKWFRGQTIRSLAGLTVAPNKSLQIVEVGHSIYLIGIGENISLIDKIGDDQEVAFILNTLSNDQLDANGWGSVGKWLKTLNKKETESAVSEDETQSFHEIFRDKMKLVSDRKKIIEDMLHEDKNKEQPK